MPVYNVLLYRLLWSYITYTFTHYQFFFWHNSSPLTPIKTLAQTLYQWLNNPIIEMTTIGYVTETLGNVIETLEYLPLSKLASVTIYTSWIVSFRFGQIFRVPEVVCISYNMGTWDLPDIYAHSLEPAASGLGIYIMQILCAHYI